MAGAKRIRGEAGYLAEHPDGVELLNRAVDFFGPLFTDFIARGYPPEVIAGELLGVLSMIANQRQMRLTSDYARARRAEREEKRREG